jgi:hypothetical protein
MTESLPVHMPSLVVPDVPDGAQGDVVVSQLITDWADWIRQMDPHDLPLVQKTRAALFELGMAEQQAFWALDEGLKMPLEQHLTKGLTADAVHDLLNQLQQGIRTITPPKKQRPSLFERFKLLFSSHQSAWDLWLEQFSEQQNKLKALSTQLERGLSTLSGENQVMASHQQVIRKHLNQLEQAFDLAHALGQGIGHVQSEVTPHQAELNHVIGLEFMPVIEQRTIELQQQLLMARQALLTFDLLIKQNEHLKRDITVAMNNSRQILEVTAGLVVARRRKNQTRQHTSADQEVQLGDIRKAQLHEAQRQIERALHDIDQVKEEARQSHQQLLEANTISNKSHSVS